MSRLPSRGRPWGPADRTGGPLDRVLALARARCEGLIVERLGDDYLFFLGDDFGLDRVQVGSGPGGEAPFLIENGGAVQTWDVEEAAAIIHLWLEEAP